MESLSCTLSLLVRDEAGAMVEEVVRGRSSGAEDVVGMLLAA